MLARGDFLMATHVKFRVRVWHDDGTAVDLSDRVISGPVRNIDVDMGDFTCDMTFSNTPVFVTADLSLDPEDSLSTLNLDGSGELDPLLDENHAVQVDYDVGAGWVPFFQGYAGSDVGSVSVSTKRHTVSVSLVGITGPLRQKHRFQDIGYTNQDLASSLLRAILTSSGFKGKLGHVLVLDDPSLPVADYTSEQTSTWRVLQDLISYTGYVLAVRYAASGTAYNDGSGDSTPEDGFYLALYDPLRSKDTPDHSWTEECVQRKVRHSIDDVRTWVQVGFTLSNGAQKFTAPATDEAARAKYGLPAGDGTKLHHQMRIVEGRNSPIKDMAAAERYADYALHDTSVPSPNVSIEIDELYADPELHSLEEFVFADYTVQMGVTQIEIDLSLSKPRGVTTISGAADKVIGLRNYWLSRGGQTEEERAAQRLNWLQGGMVKLAAPRILSRRRYVYQDKEGNSHSAIDLHWNRATEWWYGYTAIFVSIGDKGHYGTMPWLTTRKNYATVRPLPTGGKVYTRLRNYPSPNLSPQGRR